MRERVSRYKKIVGRANGIFEETYEVTTKYYGKATWTTRGRGFGRKSGWVVPKEFGGVFVITNSFRGRTPVPGSGAVNLSSAGGKSLDLETGEIYTQTERMVKQEKVTN